MICRVAPAALPSAGGEPPKVLTVRVLPVAMLMVLVVVALPSISVAALAWSSRVPELVTATALSKVMGPLLVSSDSVPPSMVTAAVPSGSALKVAVLLPTATTRPAWMSRVEPVKMFEEVALVLSRISWPAPCLTRVTPGRLTTPAV